MTGGRAGVGSQVLVGLQVALLLVTTALVAVWGVFLVYLRVGGHTAPVSLLLALLVVPLCRQGGALLGRRAGAALPAVLWLALVLVLSGARAEGDRLIGGDDVVGLLFLVLGTLAASVTVGAWRPPARGEPGEVTDPGPSPAGRGDRHTGGDHPG